MKSEFHVCEKCKRPVEQGYFVVGCLGEISNYKSTGFSVGEINKETGELIMDEKAYCIGCWPIRGLKQNRGD